MSSDDTLETFRQCKRLLISAFGVHTGGGLVLLKALLERLLDPDAHVLVDSRVRATIISKAGRTTYVTPSMKARVLALHELAAEAESSDVLFCFNGLPPLRRSAARVVLYMQNAHLLGIGIPRGFPLRTSLRLAAERLWFRLGQRCIDEVWVQTESMQDCLRAGLPSLPVRIVPLIDDELDALLRQQKRERLSTPSEPAEFVFFYPADGSPHKNQRNLLDAWALLARAGWYPTLQLTLSGREWEALQEGGAHQSAPSPSIVNLGRLSRDDALATMRAASALVFPSTLESFGLPLVEARALGVPIVASERDFVRDVCDPVQTFDPSSPRSIAAAVARFMMCQASREHDYYSAERLIDLLKR